MATTEGRPLRTHYGVLGYRLFNVVHRKTLLPNGGSKTTIKTIFRLGPVHHHFVAQVRIKQRQNNRQTTLKEI